MGEQKGLGAVFLACTLLVGCERGWLARRLAGKTTAGLAADPKLLAIGQVDCPDGLARCVGGVVQVSELAQRPDPCHGSPETCACPWTVAARCPGSCVADGVEMLLAPGYPFSHLCLDPPTIPPFARPLAADSPLPALGDACEGQQFLCIASTVVACEPTPHGVGACVSGCASDRGLSEPLTPAQASALLCTH